MDNNVNNNLSSGVQALTGATSTNNNYNNNYITSSLDNHLNNSINLQVTTPGATPSSIGNLNLDNLHVQNDGGSFLLMPDMGTQTLSGNGNLFHLDQLNSLINNGQASNLSVALDASGFGGGSFDAPGLHDSTGGVGLNFSQSLNSAGATGASGMEAFTQHVNLGSNIQYNSMPITVVGGDTLSNVSGDVHHNS